MDSNLHTIPIVSFRSEDFLFEIRKVNVSVKLLRSSFLAGPKVSESGCLLSTFGNKTRINGDSIPMSRLLLDERLIERNPIKLLSEVLSESLLARLAIACQLKKIYSSADG